MITQYHLSTLNLDLYMFWCTDVSIYTMPTYGVREGFK